MSSKVKELTAPEIRRLIKAHNTLTKIAVPKGSKKADLVKLIQDAGFKLDHVNKKIIKVRKGKQDISDGTEIKVPAPPPKKTKEEKEKAKKAAAEKKAQQRIKILKENKDKENALKKLKKLKSKKPQLTDEDKKLIEEAKKRKKKKQPPQPTPPSKPPPKPPKPPAPKKPRQPKPKPDKGDDKTPEDNPDEVKLDEVDKDGATDEQVEEIAELSPEKVMEDYKKNKIDYFVPYVGNFNVILLYMVYILEQNKNDCSISEDLLEKFVDNKGGAKRVFANNIDEVANAVVRCAKRKKMLCVPVFFNGHANMCVFNFHRGEVERYEPNGVIKGKRDNMALGAVMKKINSKIKTITAGTSGIDKDIKDTLMKGFKYLDPQSVSATESKVLEGYGDRFENFQFQETNIGADGTKRTRTGKNWNGVVIVEAGGYCVAFSFMYLDLRLKFPKMAAGELIDRCLKALNTKRGEKDMVQLIAGQTKLLYENGRKMIDGGYITEQTFIKATSSQYFKKDRSLNRFFYNTPANKQFLDGTRKYLTEKGVWARLTL